MPSYSIHAIELLKVKANLKSAIEISTNKSVIALLKVTIKNIDKKNY